MQRFYVGWFHVGWQGIVDQSDAVTQNAWFRCTLCAAISGEISILIQTGAESWGRFPEPRICRWESNIPINEEPIQGACLSFLETVWVPLNLLDRCQPRLARPQHTYFYVSRL